MLKAFYYLASVGAMSLYAWTGMTGVTFGGAARTALPADVRSAPGGYRSFHFWHSGIHGGK